MTIKYIFYFNLKGFNRLWKNIPLSWFTLFMRGWSHGLREEATW
jgi:hypothetical protein